MGIVYLKKANDDVVSHCDCKDGRVTYPAQMDCPWCGCGWLFSCISCRKAFMFAEGVELDTTWEALAREDMRGMGLKKPSAEDIASWIDDMQGILEDVEPGELYVILDGAVIPADCAGCEFEGWYARHDLNSLPQVDALSDSSIIDSLLANPEYWQANAIEEDEDEDDDDFDDDDFDDEDEDGDEE